jgi:hypothetical protein
LKGKVLVFKVGTKPLLVPRGTCASAFFPVGIEQGVKKRPNKVEFFILQKPFSIDEYPLKQTTDNKRERTTKKGENNGKQYNLQ